MDKEEERKDPESARVFVKSKATVAQLASHYDIDDKCLGSGSFGKVFLATNKADDTIKIAVKMIDAEGWSSDDRAQLENEIQIMQEVDHPNIVKYYETYYDADDADTDYVYLCMELCPRGDFFQAVVG